VSARPQTPEFAPTYPAVGELVNGKYRVDGVAGSGGMGVVVSARHEELGHQVAIKFLSSDEADTNAAVERFLREGRVIASLRSDHVVRIYDVGRLESGVPFMVMELLRGQDLGAVVSQGGVVSVEQAVDWILQAISAVAEAHERGIIHRDLKPSNLFLTQRSDGTDCVKVLDFGISKRIALQDPTQLDGHLTATRQVVGSPAYMSPEQVRNARGIDHRVDIWALGMTLYELLAGRTAFDADTFPAVCAAIVADTPPPLREFASHVPQGLEDIIMRCLEKDPAQRFASVTALAGELRPYGSPLAASTARALVTSVQTSRGSGENSSTLVSSQTPSQARYAAAERVQQNGAVLDRTMDSPALKAKPVAEVHRSVARRRHPVRWGWFVLALAGFGAAAAWKVWHSRLSMRPPTPAAKSNIASNPSVASAATATQAETSHDVVISAQLTASSAAVSSSPGAASSKKATNTSGASRSNRISPRSDTSIGNSNVPSDIRTRR
jgi:eukaryotic-like serine/threonine-protein kinase